MKKFGFAIYCICLLISCSRKAVPAKPNYSLNNGKSNNEVIVNDSARANPSADSVKLTPAGTVMIVADGYGRLLTPQQNLPQNAGVRYNSLQLSKGFTAQQRANLQARYQTVPPRVLYVPVQNSLSSLKGSYYILNKKFWYWKKSDGLFYLDPKYYL